MANDSSSSNRLIRLYFKEPNLDIPKGTSMAILSPDFKSGDYFDQAVHIESTTKSVLLLKLDFESTPLETRLSNTFDFILRTSVTTP